MAGAFNPRTGGQLETSENNEENLSQKITTGLKMVNKAKKGVDGKDGEEESSVEAQIAKIIQE